MVEIHSTAIIEEGAIIEDGVKIGPYCIVGKDVTNAIIDIGTLFSYLIDLIFLFKEPKNYIKYLIEKSYLSEIHAKEFIDYEENIIKNLSSK